MHPAPLITCALVILTTQSFAWADPFWKYWGDGKAELDGYALTQPRYGQPREGHAVLIFVTEDFSDSLRVKADPGVHPKSDVYPVLKLNEVRKFQTGIYDYSVMTSTFARVSDDFPVVKVAFSSQEWCGLVHSQWLRRGDTLEGASHSYFDREADQSPRLAVPPGGIHEEALPILIRGLRGEWLKPGESRTLPMLPSLLRTRFGHKAPEWVQAVVKRDAAGTTFTIEAAGRTLTYVIDAAPPHKILEWRSSDGERARLLGSTRLPYWELNAPGGEKHLTALGLTSLAPPPTPRSPPAPPARNSPR